MLAIFTNETGGIMKGVDSMTIENLNRANEIIKEIPRIDDYIELCEDLLKPLKEDEEYKGRLYVVGRNGCTRDDLRVFGNNGMVREFLVNYLEHLETRKEELEKELEKL